ncbi:hypothetical protein GIB67_021758 [Kingdonia uniflora]|uniref:B box-type domain-containing protein n=1 Tax=Kingdonia uniflora TaxID=39325 RepID=A0A7J7M9Q1_9MAGN|nr:hypothetical protein GIB67_021758 [Kingdonia uniflora]
MKECELCKSPARMYCESDEASLCWDCDKKIHAANFLVARHTRTLLCHGCQSPTPWKASGDKLGPTITICDRCVNTTTPNGSKEEREDESDGINGADQTDDNLDDLDDLDDEDEDEDDESDESDGGDDGDDDEDGENQVVPWSSTPPPPIASSSSSSDDSSKKVSFPFKRFRQNVDLVSQHDLICESNGGESTSNRPFKMQKRSLTTTESSETELKPRAILNSLKRFEKSIISGETSSAVLDVCKLSRDPRAVVDLISTESLSTSQV